MLATAAAQGIGRATALAFAQAGARVIATDVNAAVVRFCEGIGPVDVLFNCAGVVHNGDLLASTDDEPAFVFDLNVRSMARMIRGTLPGMLERGRGCILNMSSVASSIKGGPNRFVYATPRLRFLA